MGVMLCVAAPQFVLQLHAMWSGDIAGGPLAPAAAALQMGAKERAVYLGHRLSRNIKARRPPQNPDALPCSYRVPSAALALHMFEARGSQKSPPRAFAPWYRLRVMRRRRRTRWLA